ncbi:GNAT family N-acetyltransferase [Derxia lacustris]|uniref:GNAT family N-acetyltransferase n=1 Tax=Derxia lacustris TaxID=764842 RepID=UPI000A17845B|nr:GNAT family N-acetyltransferase [Derxia lacustris]
MNSPNPSRQIEVQVVHRPEAGRFEASVDGLRCVADYRLDGKRMLMHHTGVPPALEGRGIAAQLVAAAFDHAARAGLTIVPLCSYVALWARRHPAQAAPVLARD